MSVLPVGVNFFVTSYTIGPGQLARAVEELGFDSIWVPDHAVLLADESGYHRADRPPTVYGQMADPLVTLAFAAAATERIELATGVCLVNQRHSLGLAKAVSSLDRFSGGRVRLGVGAGWSAQEAELFGIDFAERWPIVEESVEAMRLLWSKGHGAYEGKYVRFPEVICDPLPVSRPGPPVLIGAPPTAATFRRVAEWADGWAPVFAAPEIVAAGRRGISQACEALGRDPEEIEIVAFTKDVSEPAQEAYAEAGADRLVLQLYNHPGTRMRFEDWESHHLSSGSEPPPEPARTLAVLESMAREAGLQKIGETSR